MVGAWINCGWDASLRAGCAFHRCGTPWERPQNAHLRLLHTRMARSRRLACLFLYGTAFAF
jgi:hypothetical protein